MTKLDTRSIYEKLTRDLIKSKGGSIRDSWHYKDSTDKFTVTCSKGHKWQTSWNIIQSGHWCPDCAKKVRNLNNRVSEVEVRDFIASKGGKLDPDWKYISNHEKFWVECGRGHRWQVIWNNLRKNSWCPYCSKTIVVEDDVRKYIENKGGHLPKDWKFIKSIKKFDLQCENGHSFQSCWDKIRLGHWCPYCYGNNRTEESKIKDFIKLKNGSLDSDWKYVNSTHRFWVTCHRGHRWKAIWSNIRKDHWCPKCRNSKYENRFRKIMERVFFVSFPKQKPDWMRNPLTGRILELDGYNNGIKVAFEYQGIYHYSNPIGIKFSDIQKIRDNIKEKLCYENGVALIIMPYWIKESDWEIEITNQYKNKRMRLL